MSMRITHNGRSVAGDNPFPVRLASNVKVRWTTETDWSSGTLDSNIIVVGTGSSAYITLKELSDNAYNIPFDTSASYTPSDAGKIEVASGRARLKVVSGNSQDWPFTTPANYSYSTALIDVTSGVAELKSLTPTDATFYANYDSDINGTWGDGDLTGTSFGGAVVSGGQLDLTGNSVKFVLYDADLNADSVNTGCVRLTVTPNYTGAPPTTRAFFAISADTAGVNLVQLNHQNDGTVRCIIRDQSNTAFVNQNLGAWSNTAGTPYEFEYNYDINTATAAQRLFIDGTQQGSTTAGSGIRTSVINMLIVGNNSLQNHDSDELIDDFIVFSDVQHTANYSAGSAIPQTKYSIEDPTIGPDASQSFSFTTQLNTFVETAAKTGAGIKYQATDDNGTTLFYWTGSAWQTITTGNTELIASEITTTVGTLDAGSLGSIQALDGNTYDVSEVTGAPGFNIGINYSTIPQPPNQVTIYAQYVGSVGHNVNVDIWNNSTTAWDTLGQIPHGAATITAYNFSVSASTAYLSTGTVLTRIYHSSPGNTGHDIFIDYTFLKLSTLPTNSWYYTNEANTAGALNTNLPALASTGTFNFLTFLHSDDGSQKPILDNIFIGETVSYSTDDNLYIDTKDAAQIAPSVASSWSNSNFLSQTPTNTAIGVLYSVDGRISWMTYSGGWSATGSPTLRASSISLSDATANFATLPLGSATLDLRIFLKADTTTATTPEVLNNSITVEGGFASSGTYLTSQYDSTYQDEDWGEFNSDDTAPASTAIEYRTRAANSLVELSATSFGAAIVNGDDAGTIGQYTDFRIVLSGDGTARPKVNMISVKYSSPEISVVSP